MSNENTHGCLGCFGKLVISVVSSAIGGAVGAVVGVIAQNLIGGTQPTVAPTSFSTSQVPSAGGGGLIMACAVIGAVMAVGIALARRKD